MTLLPLTPSPAPHTSSLMDPNALAFLIRSTLGLVAYLSGRFSPSCRTFFFLDTVYAGIRMYFALTCTEGSFFKPDEITSKEPTRNRLLIWLPLLNLLGLITYYFSISLPPFLTFRPLPLLGSSLFCLGILALYLSHVSLGSNWSMKVETKSTQTLVTTGIYSRIRHPMYLAFFLASLGGLFLTGNVILGGSFVGASGVAAGRIPREEKIMREAFGGEWDEYVERTRGGILPRFGGGEEKEKEGKLK